METELPFWSVCTLIALKFNMFLLHTFCYCSNLMCTLNKLEPGEVEICLEVFIFAVFALDSHRFHLDF